MLAEIAVRNLGIIRELSVQLDNQMTVLTGETGAGKTLITQAVALLLGGKAEAVLVGPWSEEAEVEGRFFVGGGLDVGMSGADINGGEAGADAGSEAGRGDAAEGSDETAPNETELIVRRVISAKGRPRAYINNQLAAAKALTETTSHLIDLHGQHLHQSLLRPAAQRDALDSYGNIDTAPLRQARRKLAQLSERLAQLGGDEQARQRSIDMLRHQIAEIAQAQLNDPDEETYLEAEEKLLAEAAESIEATKQTAYILGGDGEASTALIEANSLLQRFESLTKPANRLQQLHSELADLAEELRHHADTLEADPQRLEQIVARRNLLVELRRKYGHTLAEVMAFARTAQNELAELESVEQTRTQVLAEIASTTATQQQLADEIKQARQVAAKKLGAEIQSRLAELALPRCRFEVVVGEKGEVEFLFSANPEVAPVSLRKVAAGGELSRVTLALQLVCHSAPATVIFDEVDAGVGGTAALSVGEALAQMSSTRQVIVITHLPQVAAFANQHFRVLKTTQGEASDSPSDVSVCKVQGGARQEEIARMLSGFPDSQTALEHARELLEQCAHTTPTIRQ